MPKKQKKPVSPNPGDLRIWWMPQVPATKSFIVPVKTLTEAKLLLNALADYDQFQLDNNIKGDYANAGGLSVYTPDIKEDDFDGWCDWCPDDMADAEEIFKQAGVEMPVFKGIDDLTLDQCREIDKVLIVRKLVA